MCWATGARSSSYTYLLGYKTRLQALFVYYLRFCTWVYLKWISIERVGVLCRRTVQHYNLLNHLPKENSLIPVCTPARNQPLRGSYWRVRRVIAQNLYSPRHRCSVPSTVDVIHVSLCVHVTDRVDVVNDNSLRTVPSDMCNSWSGVALFCSQVYLFTKRLKVIKFSNSLFTV